MHQYLVEFLGSLFFVYIVLATGNPIAIGAALALVLLLVGSGHVNPVVSIVLASNGKLNRVELVPYITAQVAGGLVALEIYKKYQL